MIASDHPTSQDGRIRVGIVGATGYTGSELLRLLARHPHVEVVAVTSRAEAGRPVADLFTQLRGHFDLRFTAPDVETLGGCDLVFFATPSGTAMESAPQLLERGARVIDLAADFRLKDPALWASWYGMPHRCPALLDEAVYGLPELYREAIASARLVANPGCHATAVILGYWPLICADAVDPSALIADSKSGVSGAGRKAQTGMLMAEVGESFKAYATTGHRHAPEIAQILADAAVAPIDLTFVPHLVPMVRGILATLYARPRDLAVDVERLYAEAYRDEPFIDLMPGGHPDTRSVRGTNLCRIAFGRQGDRLIIQSVIDNLVKGAAGQALQNLNIMFGLPETTGLDAVALLP